MFMAVISCWGCHLYNLNIEDVSAALYVLALYIEQWHCWQGEHQIQLPMWCITQRLCRLQVHVALTLLLRGTDILTSTSLWVWRCPCPPTAAAIIFLWLLASRELRQGFLFVSLLRFYRLPFSVCPLSHSITSCLGISLSSLFCAWLALRGSLTVASFPCWLSGWAVAFHF